MVFVSFPEPTENNVNNHSITFSLYTTLKYMYIL